jgi:HEAT repeat protein
MSRDFLDFDDEYIPVSDLLINTFEHLSLDELKAMQRDALDGVAAGDEGAEVWLGAISLQLALHGKPGNQALWDAIEEADPRQMRVMLAGPVIDLGRRTQARRFLYRLLDHDDPEYILVGIEGFTMTSDRKARHQVLQLRQHPSADVRAGVLSYVRGVWHTDALRMMVAAFDDPDHIVRQMAVALLLDLSIVTSLEPVRAALRRQRKPRNVRDYAQDVLDRTDNPPDELMMIELDAIDYLAEMNGKIRWKDVERARREWEVEAPSDPLVAMALTHPDDKHLRQRMRELWASDDVWQKSMAISLMAILGEREHEVEILALREHESELVYPAAYMYQRMADPQAAVPALIDLLDNGTMEARLFAIPALNRIYVAEVDEQLRARLETMLDDPDETVRELAAFGLLSERERRSTKHDIPVPAFLVDY